MSQENLEVVRSYTRRAYPGGPLIELSLALRGFLVVTSGRGPRA